MQNLIRLLLVYLIIFSVPLSAQHLRLHDIPNVTLEDFKAPVKADAPYPVYMNVRVYYRIDSVVKVSDNKFKLKVITKVEPDRQGSFFDRKKVPDHAIAGLLNHEKGHVVIGFICGNKITKQLSSKVYTSNYVAEVRESFHPLLRNLSDLHREYDEGSNHGMNKPEQKLWDRKLIDMFLATFK